MTTRKVWIMAFLFSLFVNRWQVHSQTDYPVITSDNASKIKQVAQFGKGELIDADWTADGKTLVVASTLGIWLYDASNLDLPPRLLADPKEPMRVMASRGASGRIAAVTEANTLHLWNADGTNPVTVHVPSVRSEDSISSMAFNPDGTILATGEFAKVQLRDAATGKVKKILSATPIAGGDSIFKSTLGSVQSIAFSPDGGTLAAAGYWIDGQNLSVGPIVLWDVNTGKQIAAFNVRGKVPATSMAFSANGNTLYFANGDDASYQIDVLTGSYYQTNNYYGRGVMAIAASADGTTYAEARVDGTLTLLDLHTSFAKYRTFAHQAEIDDIHYSPDGKQIVSVGAEGTVGIRDVQTGQAVHVLSDFTASFGQMQISPDGKWIVAGGDKGTLYAWQPFGDKAIKFSQTGDLRPKTMAFSSDGRYLAWTTCVDLTYTFDPRCNDIDLYLWDAQSGTEKVSLLARRAENEVGQDVLAFSPDSKSLAVSAGLNNAIDLWDVNTGKIISSFPGSATAVAFSPDGQMLASSSNEGVLVYDVATGTVLQHDASGYANLLYFTPDGNLKDVKGIDFTFQARAIKDGESLAQAKWVNTESVVLNNDGSVLASADYYGKLTIRTLKTGKVLSLIAPSRGEWIVALSPDGKLLAGANTRYYADHTPSVELWDATSGKHLASLPGSILPSTAIAFSLDGRLLVSASVDGVVRMWAVGAGS